MARSFVADTPVRNSVGPGDPLVGNVGPAGEPAHLLAGFVERNLAVFEAADHFGRVAGVDQLRHGFHAEAAECRLAAVDVQIHEDASQIEDHVSYVFHPYF